MKLMISLLNFLIKIIGLKRKRPIADEWKMIVLWREMT